MTKQTESNLVKVLNVLAKEPNQACKEALEPTVAELNDEYLRDTHVEGLSTNSKANEIIKTQHWLCLDGQMVVAQLYTTPSREWVGLSDEEIGRLAVFDGLHHVEIPLLAKFIIAIEQALKEKNNG